MNIITRFIKNDEANRQDLIAKLIAECGYSLEEANLLTSNLEQIIKSIHTKRDFKKLIKEPDNPTFESYYSSNLSDMGID